MKTTIRKNFSPIRNRLNPIILIKKISTVWNDNLYKMPQYKRWRRAVFQRDHYTCQLCGAKGVPIEAHHCKRKSQYPELIFDISNGICLCKSCHEKKVTGYEKQWEKIFQDMVEKRKQENKNGNLRQQ